MFIEIKKITVQYTRVSKLKKLHTYSKVQSMVILKCDSCYIIFERLLALMNRNRLNNEYHHVCPNCNPKKFAQQKGVERRKLWDSPVDSDSNCL
jgi:hypothetical protein